MKLEPLHLESVVIDPAPSPTTAWATTPGAKKNSKKRKKRVKRVKKEDSEDEENAEEKEEDEPVRVARALSPASRRQPGANRNAIVAEIDVNAVARHLLAALDFRSPPGVDEAACPHNSGVPQNPHVESFHRRLREECLTVSWFQNRFDGRRKIAAVAGRVQRSSTTQQLGISDAEGVCSRDGGG